MQHWYILAVQPDNAQQVGMLILMLRTEASASGLTRLLVNFYFFLLALLVAFCNVLWLLFSVLGKWER